MSTEMQTEVDRITGEVSMQAELISQIKAALANKTAVKPVVVQSLTVTENGTYNPPSGVDGYAPVTVDVKSTVEVATVTPSSNNRSISFTGLSGEPKMFSVCPTENTSLSSSTRSVINVVYDGSSTRGIYSNTSTSSHTTNGFTWTYSDGTLTINTASTSNGGYFRSGVTYQLTYIS